MLSAIGNNEILHASDRLLTTRNGRAWDPVSNKTVVHFGKEHAFVSGYSGTAHTPDGRPTDHWLAEVLIGQSIPPDHGMASIGSLDLTDAHHAVQRVVEGANATFSLDPGEYPPSFIFGGLQKRRGGSRPFQITVRASKGQSYVAEARPLPHWHGRTGIYSFNGTGVIAQAPIAAMYAAFKTSTATFERRDAMITAIREIARQTRVVGQNVLSVVIAPPPSLEGLPVVRVRYDPGLAVSVPSAAHLDKKTRILYPIKADVFTPWIICRTGYFAPSLHVIGSGTSGNWQLPGLCIEYDSPTAGARKEQFWFSGSQHRGSP